MSAISAFLTPSAAYLLTDGGQFSEADDGTRGQLHRVRSKVHLMPEINAAISVVGTLAAAEGIRAVLAHGLRMHTDFDDLLEDFGNVARNVDALIKQHAPNAAATATMFRVVLIGWSVERDAPIAAVVENYPGMEAGRVRHPFGVTEVETLVSPPIPSLIDFTDDNAEVEALRIIELQRGSGVEAFMTGAGHAKGDFLIGGFAQLTRVARDGISLRVLRRWPDIIGEKVNPS